MGVFAIIGILTALVGLARGEGRVVLLGAVICGVGIAGDQNGY